ncbi:MAG: LysM peptidoglycan-binding domain-containing protein [Nitrospirota bacterium]
MLKKNLLLYLTVLLVVLMPSFVLSQNQEIKDYKIMKGDTLWDISGKELTDPFLWPKIWKENPEIKNPDKIYPEQTIRIPLYLLQKELKEEAAPAPVVEETPAEEVAEKPEPTPVKLLPLVDSKVLIASGYISESVAGLGKITGSQSGRTLFGNNDMIYVKTYNPVNIGDKFYVIRSGEMVKHPATNKKIGYLVEIVGIAEIKKFEYGETMATIIHSFADITTGDILDAYYEIIPPVKSKHYRKPATEGYIIATKQLRLINGLYDIVYIDKGSDDGIETGDMFKTIEVKESKINRQKHNVPNGAVQVISYRGNTATAIVRESTEPIRAGNLITLFE